MMLRRDSLSCPHLQVLSQVDVCCRQLPDDVVEAEQQAACLDAVVDANTELGEKTTKLTQMMVEYMIDTSRKERRVSERPRIVQDPSLPARSHGRSHH